MVFLETDAPKEGRKCRGVDRAAGTQHVHAGGHRDRPSIRLNRLLIACHDGLRREGRAEVGQGNGHGPGTVDRSRDDLVGPRRLERIANRHGVGVHLETPDPGPHFVEEVNALSVVPHCRGGAVAGDALQRRRIGWLGAGRARVQERVARDELTQIAVVGNVEVPEPSILGIRSIRLPSRQPPHRFGGDDRAQRLARRVHQIQVMRLPAKVA